MINLNQLIVYLVIICIYSVQKCALIIPKSIKLGAIIAPGEDDFELVFKHAVFLNREINSDFKLEAEIQYFHPTDSLSASNAACKLIESGVWAIVNPYGHLDSWVLRSIADRYEIPHIITSWEYPFPGKFFNHKNHLFNYTLNLYPNTETLSAAVFDYIRFNKDWRTFSILVDGRQGFIRLKNAYTIPTVERTNRTIPHHKIDLRIRKYQFDRDLDPEVMFKHISKRKDANFIISLQNGENLDKILEMFRKYRMIDLYCSYFIEDFDVQFYNLTNAKFYAFNATGFRLFDPFDYVIRHKYDAYIWRNGRNDSNEQFQLRHKKALIYDAVSLIANALNSLSQRSDRFASPSLSCKKDNTWNDGRMFMNYMRKLHVHGITGILRFDEKGQRSDLSLEIIRLKENQWSKVGYWDAKSGVQLILGEKAEERSAIDYLKTTKLKLIVAESTPYVMKKANYSQMEGEEEFEKYEGFCIDMLRQIKNNLNISGYDLIFFPGSSYGNKDKNNGSWTGMIGEMLEKNYDMAAADLTITHERQTGVDFTIPFITLGISILFTKPIAPPLNLWAFLDPFSLEVWFYVATAYIGVTLLMYYIARISPYEWLNSHPCEEEPEVLSNQFSLGNCMWFTLGSIMQQGSDLAPKALSMRFIASSWSFFTLIMVSSYTANLAAFLTVARMENPINNAEELAFQTSSNKVAYGCSRGGSTRKFFRDSTYTTYQKMFAYMESAEPPVYTSGNPDGVRRVLKGNYAFLMESLSILYNVNRYCNLTQIGDLLDQKGYGIAMRPGSPFRTIFSNEIIRMQEEGAISDLKKEWFELYPTKLREIANPDEAECPQNAPAVSTTALDVVNVGGVFIVLFIGIAISALFVMVEFFWRAKKFRREERENILVMMVRELCNICRGKSSNRRGWKKRPSSEGTTTSSSNDTGSRINSNKINGSVVESRKFTASQSIDGSKSIARSNLILNT